MFDEAPSDVEMWRKQIAQVGFVPYRLLGPREKTMEFPGGGHICLQKVEVWVRPSLLGGYYAARLTGERKKGDLYVGIYQTDVLLGWFGFRREARSWGYSPPWFWWRSWPLADLLR